MLALIFHVGSEKVALDVCYIHEVVPRVRLSKVSGGHSSIAGVFVYRGRVVPVVDLFKLTGAGECPPHLSSRIILLPYPRNAPDSLVGLLATQVAEIRDVEHEPAKPVAGQADGPNLGPVVADRTGVLHVLDPEVLLRQLMNRQVAAVNP